MTAIVTVPLNPAIDRTVWLDRLVPGRTHRSSDTRATPPVVVDQFIISLDHVVSLEPLDFDEPIVVPASPTL